MTLSRTSLVHLTLLVALAAPTDALVLPQVSTPLSEQSHELANWPTGYLGGIENLSEIQIGDFDQNGTTDAAVHSGTSLVVLHDFDDVTMPLRAKVNGVELNTVSAYAIALHASGAPQMAVSTNNGIQLLDYLSPGKFTEDTALGTPLGWADCRQLIADDFDGDGLLDLVGLAADGLEVRVLLNAASGWLVGPTIALVEVTEEIATVAWNASLELEVACLGGSGVRVMSSIDPLPIYQRLSNLAHEGGIAQVRMNGNLDRVAWSMHLTASGNTLLLLLQDNETEIHSLTPRIPAEMISGDLNADGHDDLVLTFANTHEVFALEGSGSPGGSYFDPANESTLIDAQPDVPNGSVGGSGRGAIGDINGDLLADFTTASVALGGVLRFDGDLLAGPSTVAGAYGLVLPITPRGCISTDSSAPDDGYYRLAFDIEYTGVRPEATDWRLVIWEVVPGQGVIPESRCTTKIPIAMSPTDAQEIRFDLVPDPAQIAALGDEDDLRGAWLADTRVFCMLIQPIDPSDVVFGPSIAALAYFQDLDEPDPHPEILEAFDEEGYEGWDDPAFLFNHEACYDPSAPASYLAPSFANYAAPTYVPAAARIPLFVITGTSLILFSSGNPTLTFLPARRLPKPPLGNHLTLGEVCDEDVHAAPIQ